MNNLRNYIRTLLKESSAALRENEWLEYEVLGSSVRIELMRGPEKKKGPHHNFRRYAPPSSEVPAEITDLFDKLDWIRERTYFENSYGFIFLRKMRGKWVEKVAIDPPPEYTDTMLSVALEMIAPEKVHYSDGTTRSSSVDTASLVNNLKTTGKLIPSKPDPET